MSVFKSITIGVVVLAAVVGLAVWADKKDTKVPEVSVSPSPSISSTPTESVTASASVSVSPSASPISTQKNNMNEITLSTNMGDITFQTYDADAPKAVQNFIALANKKFYDGVIFHRVIKGFMIQGGDPKGNGTGGPGYTFEDELKADTESAKLGYAKGTVAMANSGPNTNGSQFFIMHQNYPLPHDYTIFGHVVRGQEVVDKIATTPVDANDRPVSPVTIKKVTVKALK